MTKFKKIGIFSFILLVAVMSVFAIIPKGNISVNADVNEPYKTNNFNIGSTYLDLTNNSYHSIRSGSIIYFYIYDNKIVVVNNLYSSVNAQTDDEDIFVYSVNYLECTTGTTYNGEVGKDRKDDFPRKHKFFVKNGMFSSSDFDFKNLSYILVNSEYLYDNSHFVYTYFKIFDINGNYFQISIEFNAYHSSDNFNVDNLYYSTIPFYRNEKFLIGGANSSYNMGYNQGYSEGLNSSNNKGYQEGYNLGKNEGYNNGYNQALSDSESYSFTKLITSVVDAPIHVITSMFNFEFMGVNLTAFFMGLLTFCVVIFVIRLILGGKS